MGLIAPSTIVTQPSGYQPIRSTQRFAPPHKQPTSLKMNAFNSKSGMNDAHVANIMLTHI